MDWTFNLNASPVSPSAAIKKLAPGLRIHSGHAVRFKRGTVEIVKQATSAGALSSFEVCARGLAQPEALMHT